MPHSLFLAQSPPIDFLDRIDGDLLGVTILVSAILCFVLLISVVNHSIRTYERMAMARPHRERIDHLLAQGLSPHQIQALVMSRGSGKKMRRALAQWQNGAPSWTSGTTTQTRIPAGRLNRRGVGELPTQARFRPPVLERHVAAARRVRDIGGASVG